MESTDLEPQEEKLCSVLRAWDLSRDGYPSESMIARKVGLTTKALQLLERGIEAKLSQEVWLELRGRPLQGLPELSREVAVLPKDPKSSDLAAKLGWLSEKIADSITDSDLLGASLKDRAYAIDRFIEKRALLRGEPTQILSLEDRRQLPDLLRAVMKEAERRGVSFNAETGTGRVTALDVPQLTEGGQ